MENKPEILPKVSVIIPVFNGQKFLKDTIQSVINQNYKNLEIICVDDGSTDTTKNEVMNYFPLVLYYYQENKGAAAARNLGMRKASGAYIAFLDSDDIWLPEKLSMQMEMVFNNPNIKIVHTNVNIKVNEQIRDTAYPTAHQEGKIFNNLLLQNGSVVCSTLLLKKECIEKVGYFDEELRTAEDVHLFLRLAYYYDFYFLNKALVIKNHHDSNLTNINNIYFGAGSILALEKIEQLFPQFSRKSSKVMRRALFLRARLRAEAFAQRGDYRNSFLFLIKALNYEKRFFNFFSLLNQVMKICFIRIKKTITSNER